MAIVTSVLTAGSNNHTTSSEEANGIYTDFISQGIIGTLSNTAGVAPATGGYSVNAQGTPDTTIAVSSGVAYVTGTPTSQNSQRFRVKNSASTNTTISANVSGSTKYDWVYIKLDATKLNTPNTAGDDAATIVTSRSSSASSDDGTPPTYGINIAVVTVANGFTTITNSNIRDTRASAVVSATSNGTSQDWYATGLNPSSVTALGNRSYSMVFNSVDATSYLSKGMRLKATRLVAAPTQCTSLNGTTQFWSKTSPAGMTFTNNYVISGWVKLSAYPGVSGMVIASRYNGTSGFVLYVLQSGQLQSSSYNAGSANSFNSTSYQSIPLGKWVHVAVQIDMTTTSTGGTNNYIMIDGVEVLNSTTRTGTSPTTLIQAGNLEIGSTNGGTVPFNGKIAQVAIYNAKVTEATILASMHQTLSGSETSEISAYSFNNSFNDLNANANNLTANGSATATNADSPFAQGATAGSLEYGIITAASFSTNTTLTVQVPEGSALPTSGGISALSYSTQKAPYGMPVQEEKWTIGMYGKARQTSTVGTTAFTNLGHSLNIPIGEWVGSYYAPAIVVATSVAFLGIYLTLSTANNSQTDSQWTSCFVPKQTAETQVGGDLTRTGYWSLSSATPYYLNISAAVISGTTTVYIGDASANSQLFFVKAKLAYL